VSNWCRRRSRPCLRCADPDDLAGVRCGVLPLAIATVPVRQPERDRHGRVGRHDRATLLACLRAAVFVVVKRIFKGKPVCMSSPRSASRRPGSDRCPGHSKRIEESRCSPNRDPSPSLGMTRYQARCSTRSTSSLSRCSYAERLLWRLRASRCRSFAYGDLGRSGRAARSCCCPASPTNGDYEVHGFLAGAAQERAGLRRVRGDAHFGYYNRTRCSTSCT